MAQQHVLLIAEKPESEALFPRMHLQEVYYIAIYDKFYECKFYECHLANLVPLFSYSGLFKPHPH